jgi:hypothetical protein
MLKSRIVPCVNEQKSFQLNIIILGLDPNPDQAGSRSGFSKIPGSGSGTVEYESRTLDITLANMNELTYRSVLNGRMQGR